MIEISKHIEMLLLEHDCVIVPGLGGFVTQYASAYRIDDEQLFLPPHRNIGFNTQLTLNDGLLVQSYMQAYDISYAEAMHLLDDTIADIKKKIITEGIYEFNGIGTLSSNLSGNLSFTPNEAGVIAPNLYGLSSLSVQKIEQKTEDMTLHKQEHTKRDKEENISKSKTYTFKLNREFCNYVAAVAIAVVFYIFWATPIGTTPSQQNKISSAYGFLLPQNTNISLQAEESHIKNSLKQGNSSLKDIETATQTIHTIEENRTELLTSKEEITSNAKLDTKRTNKSQAVNNDEAPYTIVMLSGVPVSNAQQFVNELKSKGLEQARVYIKRKMTRVIFGHYNTEEDAIHALRKLRKDQLGFQDSWVLKIQ